MVQNSGGTPPCNASYTMDFNAYIASGKDPGLVPGATVVAVNTGTKDTYETTTNAQGQYNIQFVRPGRYDITVSMQGFQASRTTGIELTTNQVVRTNATLQVGAITDSVSVEARAQVLDTDRATISETINERAIVELRELSHGILPAVLRRLATD